MNETIAGAPKPLIEPNNSGKQFGLTVSQQPGFLYIGPKSAPAINPDPTFMAAYLQASKLWMQAVWDSQVEARLDQSRWSEAVIQLSGSVGLIQKKLDGLTVALEKLAEQRTFVVPLTTLEPEPKQLQLKLNLPVTIEGDGEDFTATYTEANVSASGETEADAIANLKGSLISAYLRLEAIDPSKMAPLPCRQWAILKNAITR